ncbi:FHA domain-containing protein [Agromyces aurantiacus]|uniref:FHA domain-containing protein n=1 Tax=Agromyces aurantiacus TaxID=165814 RepID=A0ABV9R796_9MICO|nr:FHA domain-containing protein [Agromyces aurantiacus]MBM7505094.1 hypothetical protein [Agromyces aurantiacus]
MAEYRPDDGGRWVIALREDALLMLPADRADDLASLWPRLGAADAATQVIDRLAAGGVASVPSFALVVRERASGTARAVVRGALTVRLGDVEVSGEQVSTWQERVVGGAPAVRVSAAAPIRGDDGAPRPANPVRLPLIGGAVLASEVEWAGDEATRPVDLHRRDDGSSAQVVAAPVPVPSSATVDERSHERPDERTMVPEDTVVGFSRTERPQIPPRAERVPSAADVRDDPSVDTTVIVPPPGIAADASAAPPAVPSAEPPRSALGDHDGLTVASADIRRLREQRETERAGVRPGAAAPGAATPSLALRLPDGSIEPIVGELVLGRAPAIGRVVGARVPRTVVIGAGDPDISRTHLRVVVEGGTAVVTDLESRNGTHVVAPGLPPVRLRPAEPTPVLPETVIDLGGGWTIQVVTR